LLSLVCVFFFSSRRRHTRFSRDWSSDVCSSDLGALGGGPLKDAQDHGLGGGAVADDHPLALVLVHVLGEAADEGLVGFCLASHRSEERRVGKECGSGWSSAD